MAVSNSYFNDCFNTWLQGLLGGARPYYQNFLTVVPNKAKYGMDVTVEMNKHKVMTRVMGYLMLVYWRAWDYNMWYATTDDAGCKQVLPLGSFVTDDMVACLLREGDCHQLDLRPLLRLAGIRPLPDGISVMQINGNGQCDSIIFQVDRERRIDSPPATDINYNV